MDGTDLRRRIGWARSAAAALARVAPLRRRQPQQPLATAEDCLRRGMDPARRLEPLRRGALPGQTEKTMSPAASAVTPGR